MDDLSVRLSAVALTARVTLVHEPMMLGHVPPALADVKELPVRVAAIEAQLRGHADWQRFNDPHPLQVADEAELEAQHWGPSSPVRAASIKPAVLERRAKAQAESEPLDTLFGRDGGVGGPETLSTVAFPTQEAPLASSEWARCAIVRAPVAPVEWLLLVHSEKHLRNVARKTLIARGGALAFTDKDCSDLYFCPETLHAARLAAGGAVAAVQSLFPRDSGSAAAFAIVRPPGHHCGRESPNGFCFLSNTAIAAQYARTHLGVERVAIVDTDYHPGDGTQSIFYTDPSVLTISMHVACRVRLPHDIDCVDSVAPKLECVWPQRADKLTAYAGYGAGAYYNVNIPWPHEYVDDSDYEEAFRTIVLPLLRSYRPQLIVWACGFDAVSGDALAGTKLSPRAYARMARHLMGAVDGTPVAAILEGGYDPSRIALAAQHVVQAMLAGPCAEAQADPLLHGWSAPLPRPHVVAPNAPGQRPSARLTPLGVEWRPFVPGVVRPEAVLEFVRRFLNASPVWAHLNLPQMPLVDGEIELEVAPMLTLIEAIRATKIVNLRTDSPLPVQPAKKTPSKATEVTLSTKPL